MTQPWIRAGSWLVAALHFACAAQAASISAPVFVMVQLQGNTGTCTSQTFSAQTNAIVQVVCGTNQFVSIEPNPARRFLGVHGTAHRFSFESSRFLRESFVQQASSTGTFGSGSGNVTSLRVLGEAGPDGSMEMLVTF